MENRLALRCARGSPLEGFEPWRGASKKFAMAPPFMLWRALEVETAVGEEAVARSGGDVLVRCLAILFPTRRRMITGAALL